MHLLYIILISAMTLQAASPPNAAIWPELTIYTFEKGMSQNTTSLVSTLYNHEKFQSLVQDQPTEHWVRNIDNFQSITLPQPFVGEEFQHFAAILKFALAHDKMQHSRYNDGHKETVLDDREFASLSAFELALTSQACFSFFQILLAERLALHNVGAPAWYDATEDPKKGAHCSCDTYPSFIKEQKARLMPLVQEKVFLQPPLFHDSKKFFPENIVTGRTIIPTNTQIKQALMVAAKEYSVSLGLFKKAKSVLNAFMQHAYALDLMKEQEIPHISGRNIGELLLQVNENLDFVYTHQEIVSGIPYTVILLPNLKTLQRLPHSPSDAFLFKASMECLIDMTSDCFFETSSDYKSRKNCFDQIALKIRQHDFDERAKKARKVRFTV